MLKQRKRKTKDPCPECFLHKTLCLCADVPTLHLKTRICLVIHAKEMKRTTNTGRLALKALPNSEMRVRGQIHETLDLSDLLTNEYQTLLFYPCDEAHDLNSEFMKTIEKPIQLIVPDGNWRQASKVHYRHHELKNIPRVMVKAANMSQHHLRAESTEEGMATLQAISYALGVIEGADIQEKLLKIYETKLQRTLKARGQKI